MSNFHVAWLLCYISIASISAAVITPALPQIQDQFALDIGDVEWVISAFLIGYVIGQLIYGPIANQYGRLKALRIGLSINLAGILICFVALFKELYWLLIIGRLISALGSASGLACTFMLINEWLPEHQQKPATAYSILSFALGAGFAVMIGGIITQYWVWQGCFLFLLIHGVVMLFGTRVFSETLVTPKPIHVMSIMHDYGKALSSLRLVIFSLTIGSCTSVSYCFAAAGPQIAHDVLHLSAAAYGYWNIINIGGMLVGGLLGKELLVSLNVKPTIVIGLLGFAAGIISLLLMFKSTNYSSVWFFLTTASLYLFSSFLYAGGSYIASNTLEDKASAAAMMSFLNMSFATINVILMGYLSNDPLQSFILVLGMIWLFIILLLFLLNIKKQC